MTASTATASRYRSAPGKPAAAHTMPPQTSGPTMAATLPLIA